MAARADDGLAGRAQLAHQRHEVAVRGHDDEGVHGGAVEQVNGIDAEGDVAGVLGHLGRVEVVDRLDAQLQQLVALAGAGGPVGIGPFHDDAPEVRELVKQPLDGTESYVFIVDQDRYLRFTHM